MKDLVRNKEWKGKKNEIPLMIVYYNKIIQSLGDKSGTISEILSKFEKEEKDCNGSFLKSLRDVFLQKFYKNMSIFQKKDHFI